MGLRSFREKFRGREFWRGANTSIGVSLYTLLLVGIMAFPMYLGYLILIYVVIIPSYVAFFIDHLRKMEKQDKGSKVIEGWITHAYGVGERIYIYPVKFEVVEKLSPTDLKAVKEYVVNLKQYSKAAESATGLSKFKPKQLTLKESSEIDAMNVIERKKFDEEELKEIDIFKKELIAIRAHKKVKEKIINGDELKIE